MQIPLEITFHQVEPSEAVEAKIKEKVEKLARFHDRVIGCRVVVEAPHSHHHKGKLYAVRLYITVPNGELVINKDQHDKRAHEDIYVALRDAFDAGLRRLESYAQKQRGDVKAHEGPPMGRVSLLERDAGYGNIETVTGRLIYFHRNSLLNGDFESLDLGRAVTFVEEQGIDGPQASTVRLV